MTIDAFRLPRIEVIRGDDLVLACAYTVDGVAASLDGVSIASQVRSTSGKLMSSLAVEIVSSAAGTFTLRALYADTALWPPGVHVMDIQYTIGLQRRHTTMVAIEVASSATIV